MMASSSVTSADRCPQTFEIKVNSAIDGTYSDSVSFVMVDRCEEAEEVSDGTRLNSREPKVMYLKRTACTCEVPAGKVSEFWRGPINNVENYIQGPDNLSGGDAKEGYVRFGVHLYILCMNAKSWPQELKMMPHEVRHYRNGLECAKRLRRDMLRFWQERETCAFPTTGYIEDDLMYRVEFARREGMIYEIALVAHNTIGQDADILFSIAIRVWDAAKRKYVYSKGQRPSGEGAAGSADIDKGAIVGTFKEEAVDAILAYLDRNYVEYLPLPLAEVETVDVNV